MSNNLMPCKEPMCPSYASNKGYCDKHKRDRGVGRVYRKDLYSTLNWRRIRGGTLSSSPLCVRCLHYDIVTIATDVDHIIPHRGEGYVFSDVSMLQSLCHSCHSWKTSKEKNDIFYYWNDDGSEEFIDGNKK